jgi:hypothetical protein
VKYLNLLFRVVLFSIFACGIFSYSLYVARDIIAEITYFQENVLKIDVSDAGWLLGFIGIIYLSFALPVFWGWIMAFKIERFKEIAERYSTLMLRFICLPMFSIMFLSGIAYLYRGTIWFRKIFSDGTWREPRFVFQFGFTALVLSLVFILSRRGKSNNSD